MSAVSAEPPKIRRSISATTWRATPAALQRPRGRVELDAVALAVLRRRARRARSPRAWAIASAVAESRPPDSRTTALRSVLGLVETVGFEGLTCGDDGVAGGRLEGGMDKVLQTPLEPASTTSLESLGHGRLRARARVRRLRHAVERPAGRVVELAVLAERAGLDLVSFQDHPYQARFLDTWTLLSFVAARTERVRLAPNVLNLPLRPPAVVARAVASLDLLSGGRAELGLGAGGFWDAIEAMGGRRLTPGESVEALEEAIDVIRALWDVERAGAASVRRHVLRAARRRARAGAGAPRRHLDRRLQAAHAEPHRAQGRRLAAEPAYLEPGELAAGNAAIDAAARGRGARPAAIRRLLNVCGPFSADAGRLEGRSRTGSRS